MLNLQPMTQEEFTAYKSWDLENYAHAVADNYRLSIDEARVSAARQFNNLLNQGLATPRHFLYNIVLSTNGGESHIGYLWILVDDQT